MLERGKVVEGGAQEKPILRVFPRVFVMPNGMLATMAGTGPRRGSARQKGIVENARRVVDGEEWEVWRE